MSGITLRSVSKTFTADTGERPVLVDISLAVKRGEIVALRGDNGTGKTTLLNIVAGIEPPTCGTVLFDETTERPKVGFAQQDYTASLLPWLNTLDNIALPLKLGGIARSERDRRARELLNRLTFSNLPWDAFPHELSGGQKQRVAVSRALMHDPDILILDEPFANLDAHTIRDLQAVLSAVHAERRQTIMFVSHEIGHCISLADRIVVLHGAPATVGLDFAVDLPRPRTREVIRSPEYATIRAQILEREESLYATV